MTNKLVNIKMVLSVGWSSGLCQDCDPIFSYHPTDKALYQILGILSKNMTDNIDRFKFKFFVKKTKRLYQVREINFAENTIFLIGGGAKFY